jgi:heptosyltransferase II
MPQFAMHNSLSSPAVTRPLQCKHLVVVMPTWIGDACMATPTLRALRARYPELKISLVCRPVIRDLIWNAWGESPAWADSVWLVSKSSGPGVFTRGELMRAIRSSDIDAAILLPNAFWSAAVMRLAGVKRLIGYHRDARGWLLSDRVPVPKHRGKPRPVPMVDYYAALAAWVDAPVHDRSMQLAEDTNGSSAAKRLLQIVGYREDRPLLIVNSGAATEASRIWPEERVSQLATRAATELGWFVLIHCGPRERQAANQIAEAAAHPHVASMGVVEELPIELSKSVLARATAVVTTDSGPRHIAVAFNRRVITLFGPTSPLWTATYNMPETILQGMTAAAGTRSLAGAGDEASPTGSMADISVERVFEALRDLRSVSGIEGQAAA